MDGKDGARKLRALARRKAIPVHAELTTPSRRRADVQRAAWTAGLVPTIVHLNCGDMFYAICAYILLLI